MLSRVKQSIERIGTEVFACTPEMSDNVLRGGALGGVEGRLTKIARSNPDFLSKVFQHVIVQPGYLYVASGNEQLVVRRGDEIIKIHRASRHMSEKARQSTRAEMDEGYKVIEQYLGELVPKQETRIGRTPLRDGLPAIVTVQEYIEPKIPDVVRAHAQDIRSSFDASSLFNVSTGIASFCTKNNHMMKETSFGADVGGLGNIILTPYGNTILLDTYPTTQAERQRPSLYGDCATIEQEHRTISSGLEALAACLGTVARKNSVY